MTDLYVQGRRIRIDPSRAIGKGGEADIYDLGGGRALKVYKQPDHPDLVGLPSEQQAARDRLATHQRKLKQFPHNLPPHVIVPGQLATDQSGNTVLGYVMPLISDAEVLVRYGERAFRDAGVSNDVVVSIFRGLHETVAGTHAAQVVLGDFNDLNILVKGIESWLIDADSFQFGRFPCRVYTAGFVDPLRCDPSAKNLVLVRPHTEDSDWYAFAIMLMRSLLFAGPYDGIYIPKDKTKRMPHPARPLHRITVFHPEVRYPKPATPFGMLPDDLLEYFHQVFEKDKRGEFPVKLLDIRWTTCTNCGTQHARSSCPQCSLASPGAVREVTTVEGTVTATREFTTSGLIVYASVQTGKLLYIVHENGQYRREGGSLVMTGALDRQMRFRIRGASTLLGKGNRLVTITPGENPSSTAVDTVGLLPIFDANQESRYWTADGQLMRDGAWGVATKVGNVLSGQTLFWVGTRFGFGFYRAGTLSVAFVFDAKDPGLNDSVRVPIHGQLIDSTCFFTSDRCWFLVSTRENGVTKNSCHVIRRDGSIEATAEADANDGSWLGTLRGKQPLSTGLFAATDEGIVSVKIDAGQIVPSNRYPDTEPFVSSASHLFAGPNGFWAVTGKEVVRLRIS